MNNWVENLRKHLESLSEEEKEQIRKDLKGPEIPKGWISIEDHLPMFKCDDIMLGCSTYTVKDTNGNIFQSSVSDHNTWYYGAKKIGITHWLNE